MDTPNKPDRPLFVAGLTVLVLVLVAVAVIVFRPEPTVFDPSTPEGVVQTYVRAVLDKDDEAAMALLADETECEPIRFGRSGDDSIRVTLGKVEIDGDRATVDVRITTSGGGSPFDRWEYSETDSFTLTRQGGEWLIKTLPWRFVICEKGI